MGLSGPKKRSRISQDPNNNAWSSSTERFGHRMLTSQGWTPGSYLGPKDAAHSEHFSAANASHIRVLLKDDNLGLGAKRGAKAETFGLSTLQGIFGRLNGKSDAELVKEETTRRDTELALYQGQRWGHVQFISGGFLVGDSIEKKTRPAIHMKTTTSKPSKLVAQGANSTTSRKRKRDALPATKAPESSLPQPRATLASNKDEEAAIAHDSVRSSASTVTDDEVESNVSDRRRRKEERRKRREEKQQRKAERQLRRDAKAARRKQRALAHEEKAKEKAATVPVLTESSVQAHATNTVFGRHAVRSRYIRQKRMALSDTKALSEILMIKAHG